MSINLNKEDGQTIKREGYSGTYLTRKQKIALCSSLLILPFVGASISYLLIPEKVVENIQVEVVEVEKEVEKIVRVEVPSQDVVESSTDIDVFTGHYDIELKSAWGQDASCNLLVVSDSVNDLDQYFIDMVNRGNTVQSLDEIGRLKLNLPWGQIPDSDLLRIMNADEENPVSLVLQKRRQEGRAAFVCESFFNYIGILE